MHTTALVLFSGGQDSTTCLAHALERYERVETLGFDYGQRHSVEMQARTVVLAQMRERFPNWTPFLGQDHVLSLDVLRQIGGSSLTEDTAKAAEVMDELIKVSKEIVAADDEAKHMGLSDFEYAFYTAVANNDSARELMQQDKLRELAVVLTQRVRDNASIDWTIKENVRAKLKVIVKRTLRQFGYPPNMDLLATETVLKQAEMIANELTQ